MRRILLSICLLICFGSNAQHALDPVADSLLRSLASIQDDTSKARTYNRLFNQTIALDPRRSILYGYAGLAQVQRMKWEKGQSIFYDNLGRAYSDLGFYDSSMLFFALAARKASIINERLVLANTYNNMAVAAQNIRADYTTAANYYFRALHIAESVPDSNLLGLSYSNIARIYMLQNDYNKSIQFDAAALSIRERRGNIDDIANSLQSLAKTYWLMKDSARARNYFERAKSLYERSGNISGVASVYAGISLIYGKNYRRTLEARIRAKELYDEINPLSADAITNTGNIGHVLFDIARYDSGSWKQYGQLVPQDRKALLDKAESYIKNAIRLASSIGDVDNASFFTGTLSEVEAFKGDFKNAYFHQQVFREAQDSIYSQANKNRIAEAESQRQIEMKNSEIQINKLRLSNQRRIVWGLTAGVALFVIIGLLLYRSSIIRKRANRQLAILNKELDEANKVKTTFFGILSHDLRAPISNLVNFLHLQKESPELLSEELKLKHEEKITRSAESLLENMETMLLWSKSQMDRFAPEIQEVNIADVLEEVRRSFPANDQQIAIAQTGDIIARTDKNYLYTILYNITANSLKAVSTTTSPMVHLLAERNEGVIKIWVEDNGSGFPAEFLKHWNDQQLSLGGRHGLGMHIVNDLAKAIQCKIELGNTDYGARVCLSCKLPAR